jgi:hypothetical protein
MVTYTYRKFLTKFRVLPKGWAKVKDSGNNVKGYARPFGFYEVQRPIKRTD